jgi:broad specificity phosphatase PhoE
MSTELILIRHGNAIRVHGDYVHAPLTTLGEHQAALTGAYLSERQPSLDGFYTSPIRRAKETAAIIGTKLGKTPEVENGIREVEGLEVPTLALLESLSILDFVEDYLDARAGKSIRWPIEGRVSKALMEMVETHPNQRIAVVAHSGVISSVLAWAFPEQRLKWWLTTVGNCSLTRLRADGAHIELLAVNETQHLAPEVTTVQPPDRAVQLTKKVMETVEPVRNATNSK